VRRRGPSPALRALRTLLILAVLAGVAVGAYLVVSESGQRGMQLNEQIQGDVNHAVQEIQELISENTR
jgi:hypothetical protein